MRTLRPRHVFPYAPIDECGAQLTRLLRMTASAQQTRRLAFAAAAITASLLATNQIAAQAPEGFVSVQADSIQWRPHPVVRGGFIAVLAGNPMTQGPYVIRMRFPPNSRVEAHTHPEERTYTVLAGEWKLGFGETFNDGSLRSYRTGALYRLPRGVAHFQASGSQGETVIQVAGNGPSSTDFIKR